jgi:isocitrate/isopropylmalate dehydrogenase
MNDKEAAGFGVGGRRHGPNADMGCGAVGAYDYEVRPEAGLLRLRKDLELFANLRPAICYPALAMRPR